MNSPDKPVGVHEKVFEFISSRDDGAVLYEINAELVKHGIHLHHNTLSGVLKELQRTNRIYTCLNPRCSEHRNVLRYISSSRTAKKTKHTDGISWGLEQLLGYSAEDDNVCDTLP